MFYLATLTLISLVLNGLDVRLPFRFGSVEGGNAVRPAIYYIVEDIVAVDGFGGIEYRQAFMNRYESSQPFRRMIWNLSVVWMIAFYIFAVVFTIFVFRLPKSAVYAVGWAGPFPLGGVMAFCTILYVQSCLKEERRLKENDADCHQTSTQRRLSETVSQNERTPLLGSI